MPRRVFYSFHYAADAARAAMVRNIGAIEGSAPASDNEWESIKSRGTDAIQWWIDAQMSGKSCVVVLIGAQTAQRPWVRYEIEKGWRERKGVLGIYVHNLSSFGEQSARGANPFHLCAANGTRMSSIVAEYEPPFARSTDAYNYIAVNLAGWLDRAVEIRERYP